MLNGLTGFNWITQSILNRSQNKNNSDGRALLSALLFSISESHRIQLTPIKLKSLPPTRPKRPDNLF